MALTFLASVGTGVVWNGVSFIAKHDYGFSQRQTMSLYLALGVVYVAGALAAGPLLRRLERRFSPRTVLAFILVACALVCTGPALHDAAWMLCAVALGNSVLSSLLWPIVESYLTAGRHGAAMRRAIGWWNLSWTLATACSLFGMAPLMDDEPRRAIVLLGALNLLAVIPLLAFTPSPAGHDPEAANQAVSAEYPILLRAARMLLPLSYVLNAAMSPLLPYLFDRFALDVRWETPVAATWMSVRVLAMALMWRLGFWHGRWGTLLLGGICMTAGFAIVVLSVSVPMMMAGLGCYGAGMGIVYYAALYYAMSVGHAQVEAGGTHEALIGAGYAVGPAAGLAGFALTDAARSRGLETWDGAGVVAVVLAIMAVSAIGAGHAYASARAGRKRAIDQPRLRKANVGSDHAE